MSTQSTPSADAPPFPRRKLIQAVAPGTYCPVNSLPSDAIIEPTIGGGFNVWVEEKLPTTADIIKFDHNKHTGGSIPTITYYSPGGSRYVNIASPDDVDVLAGIAFTNKSDAERASRWLAAQLRMQRIANALNAKRDNSSEYGSSIRRVNRQYRVIGNLPFNRLGIAFTNYSDARLALDVATAEGWIDDLFNIDF